MPDSLLWWQDPVLPEHCRTVKRFLLPVAIGALILAFWFSPDVQIIAAGIAIFLFGMMMLEDGFKLLGGGILESLLERATKSVPRAIGFGIVTTTILQSSSLVSVLTISFLSAGLISLIGGVGIILGANVGTTTGAWLVAGLGLKVDIGAYAMPMLALSIVLVFQRNKVLRGAGFALGGLGFLFLGIHYMKEGFETFQDSIDLTKLALGGVLGLAVYTLVGALATVVMQSSHATMVLILTALAAGQISYENALALAIGSNIGTTITAIIGALGANYQGQRLALAHLIFNLATATFALALIVPLRDLVDAISAFAGIGAEDYALKLAVFHTVFNVMGVMLMLPVLKRLIVFLEHRIKSHVPGVSQPHYLNPAVAQFPQTLEPALRKEVQHLYDNAAELILHGVNLHRDEVYAITDLEALVQRSRIPIEQDLELAYEQRIKTLYSAIIDYSSRPDHENRTTDIIGRIHAQREVANKTVAAVKSVKHLRKNVLRFTTANSGVVTEIYDELRLQIARILVEIRHLADEPEGERSALWLDQERAQIEEDAQTRSLKVEELIRRHELTPLAATSFLNDSNYAYGAMRDLIDAATIFYRERDTAIAEVETLLALEDDELDEPDDQGDDRNNSVTDRH